MEIRKFLAGIIGFFILDLYFNLVPVQIGNPYLQFASTLVFFPLAYFVAKMAGLNGIKALGVVFHAGWKKNFFYSFMIGFGCWMMMFTIEFLGGQLEFCRI